MISKIQLEVVTSICGYYRANIVKIWQMANSFYKKKSKIGVRLWVRCYEVALMRTESVEVCNYSVV